jgi:manganese/zinc/iron transport system permease protein
VNVIAWHYALMGMVSITTVFSFESVGAILVVAMFTAPPATAYLLTDKLKTMIKLSIVFALTSSISGYYLAWYFNSSVSGAIAMTAGIQFSFAFALSLYNKHMTSRKPVKQI